jgi:hypothetical protein
VAVPGGGGTGTGVGDRAGAEVVGGRTTGRLTGGGRGGGGGSCLGDGGGAGVVGDGGGVGVGVGAGDEDGGSGGGGEDGGVDPQQGQPHPGASLFAGAGPIAISTAGPEPSRRGWWVASRPAVAWTAPSGKHSPGTVHEAGSRAAEVRPAGGASQPDAASSAETAAATPKAAAQRALVPVKPAFPVPR